MSDNRLFSPVEIADICDRAAKLLERDGWTQGGFGWNEATGARCLVRAIADAAREVYDEPSTLHAVAEACLAVEERRSGAQIYGSVGWNDAAGRTAEEVLYLLRQTERELREEALRG